MRALRTRDYAIFWAGALVSNSGTWLQGVAIPYVLFQLTRSATWVGLATFATFLPIMLLAPFGGVLADRYSRKRVLLVGQSLAAVFAILLWAVWSAGLATPGWILVLTALGGSAAGLTVPAWQAFVPTLVEPDDLPSAITLNSVQFNASRAIGPMIGGIVLAQYGAAPAFLMNAISFVAVFIALLLIRARRVPPQGATARVVAGIREALVYLRTRPGITLSILVAVTVGFLGYPIVQFTVVFAEDIYMVGPEALGYLLGSLGLGAILVAPWVAGAFGDVRPSAVVQASLPVYAVAIIAFGLSRTYVFGLLAAIVVGGGFLALIATTNTATQTLVDEHMRGRVLALRVMGFTGAYPIGGLLQGWLADVFSPPAVVTTAGVLLLLIWLWARRQTVALARLDEART
ncbi:MAG: MFS transporter [Acidimicrobiia bacterium]|nr:MFS transporter [Acidimicrobiia bacterium]